MRVSTLIAMFMLVAILGAAGVGYLFYKSQGLNVTERNLVGGELRKLRQLDMRMNQLALRSRFGFDQDYDALSEIPAQIEDTLFELAAGPFNRGHIDGTLVERHFRTLRSTLVTKTDAVEDFKSHNSILRNSVTYAPKAADQLAEVAEKNGQIDLANRIRAVTRALLDFSLSSSPPDSVALSKMIDGLDGFDRNLPEESRTEALQFMMHARTVLKEQPTTRQYLQKTLTMPTVDNLESLQAAFDEMFAERANQSQHLDAALAGYAGLMLAGFFLVAFRLRRLYTNLDQEVQERTRKIEESQKEVAAAEKQVIQSEKMASLGQMVAGIAHEINTPLGYVRNNLLMTRDAIEEIDGKMSDIKKNASNLKGALSNLKEGESKTAEMGGWIDSIEKASSELDDDDTLLDLRELLNDSVEGTDRISELVQGLKDFSRLDREKVAEVDIHECIESALTIGHHVVKEKADVDRDFDKVPRITCAPSELNQVFLNIITNAAQAIKDYGRISIATRADFDNVYIRIRDNGPGIPSKVREKMFDPFFTTKPVGQGTGLGLSISWKIVESHGGRIAVRTRPNEGSEFIVVLPRSDVDRDKSDEKSQEGDAAGKPYIRAVS